MLEETMKFVEAVTSVNRVMAVRIMDEYIEKSGGIAGLEGLLVPAFDEIGEGWASGRYALAQVYMSGRICEEYVTSKVSGGADDPDSRPRLAIAVLDDHHLLGKRIVQSILTARGFRVRDYGRMELEGLAERAKAEGIDVLLVSVLMLNSALKVAKLKERLADAGTKIIVGGAPFRLDAGLGAEVGADAVCRTASEGADAIRRVMVGAA